MSGWKYKKKCKRCKKYKPTYAPHGKYCIDCKKIIQEQRLKSMKKTLSSQNYKNKFNIIFQGLRQRKKMPD